MNIKKAWWFLGGQAIDADATAFNTAAGITDPTQKNAINTLVIALKAANLWTSLTAIWPYVGGTASTHKWNLKDPRDLDAAYRLVFAGGITHDSNGVTFNGSTGYADTKLNALTVFSTNYMSMHNYVRSWTTGVLMSGSLAQLEWSVNSVGANGNTTGVTFPAIKTGMLSVTRDATNVYKTSDGAVQTFANAFTGNGNINMNIGRYATGSNLYSNANIAFSAIGTLTSAQSITLDAIVYNYQVALSRNVTRNDFAFYFGDSITAGFGVTATTRWSYLLSVNKSWNEVNFGITDTTLQNENANSMINRLALIPTKQDNFKGLFISYAYNDVTRILLGTSGFSESNYQSTLATIIAAAKAKGWTDSTIFINVAYYEETTSWQGSGSGLGMPIYSNLITNAGNECTISGATHLNPFSISAGGFIEGAAPKIHPDATRHAAIATYLDSVIP